MKNIKKIQIIRRKNKKYTIINNSCIRDNRLSLKAKGLMLLVMSLPDDWDFSIQGLSSIVKEGKTSIYSAINELKKFGYCKVVPNHDDKGIIIRHDYTFFEEPHVENPHVENPDVENQPQTNKDIKEISKETIKELKEKFAKFVSLYRKAGGRVRGVDTEFNDFKERHKKNGYWMQVVPYLELALQREVKARNQAKANNTFFPQMKNLKTYLGKQKAWELFVTIGEDITKEDYTPTCGGALNWNDYYKCYMYVGYWDGHISDGYSDDERPDGASVTLNNGRGTIVWDKETKQWVKN